MVEFVGVEVDGVEVGYVFLFVDAVGMRCMGCCCWYEMYGMLGGGEVVVIVMMRCMRWLVIYEPEGLELGSIRVRWMLMWLLLLVRLLMTKLPLHYRSCCSSLVGVDLEL